MAGSGIASYKGGSLTLPRTSNFLFYGTTAVYRVADPGRFQPGSDTKKKLYKDLTLNFLHINMNMIFCSFDQ